MKYHWGEWTLDRESGLLKRHGRPVDASRKMLECMDYLISHRERVVGYDELIRKVWGHEDVANNRLSQLILSIRRLLGDDGHAQRLIRTAPGMGYQWVGALGTAPLVDSTGETAQAGSTGSGQPRMPGSSRAQPSTTADAHHAGEAARAAWRDPETGEPRAPGEAQAALDAHPQSGAPADRPRSRAAPIAVASVLLLCAAITASVWLTMDRRPQPAAATESPYAMRSMHALESAMRAGEFDAVRDGLAALPASLAESPDAMLIAMRLDFYRGRFERAREKLDAQLALARGADDPIWQAKLLVFGTALQGRMGASAAQREATIQEALDLLGTVGEDGAPDVLADALRSRATILLLKGEHQDAARDLSSSARIFERMGDTRSAIIVRTDRARIWMRTGRLDEALRAMRGVADDYEALSDRIGTVAALNTTSRIQMELLRWDDAMQTSERAIALLRESPEIERRDRTLQLRAQVLTRLGRMRQARALLEEVGALEGDTTDSMIGILYLLEAGKNEAALDASARAFALAGRDDPDDILLETRDGALLTWVTAAQRIADARGTMAMPSPAQIDALRNPRSISGTIASARWAMTQNEDGRAESLLNQAIEEAKAKGMRYHMVLATEAFFHMLLRQGRTEDAGRLLDDVRAYDRERMDRDFQFLQLRWRLNAATGNADAANAVLVKLRELAGERAVPGQGRRRRV